MMTRRRRRRRRRRFGRRPSRHQSQLRVPPRPLAHDPADARTDGAARSRPRPRALHLSANDTCVSPATTPELRQLRGLRDHAQRRRARRQLLHRKLLRLHDNRRCHLRRHRGTGRLDVTRATSISWYSDGGSRRGGRSVSRVLAEPRPDRPRAPDAAAPTTAPTALPTPVPTTPVPTVPPYIAFETTGLHLVGQR